MSSHLTARPRVPRAPARTGATAAKRGPRSCAVGFVLALVVLLARPGAASEASATVATVIRSCRRSNWNDGANPKRNFGADYCNDASAATGNPTWRESGCSEAVPHGPAPAYGSRYSRYPACVEQCKAQASCNYVRWISSIRADGSGYRGSWKGANGASHGWCQGLATCTPNSDGNWNTMAVRTVTTQSNLNSCSSWSTAGGGFTPSSEMCIIKSCRRPGWTDSGNPHRNFGDDYCRDDTSQASLNSCSSWSTAGGGFKPSLEPCPQRIKSCRRSNWNDKANPKRNYGNDYCNDASPVTGNDAAAEKTTQYHLDKCDTWSTDGGGFTPSLEPCPPRPGK